MAIKFVVIKSWTSCPIAVFDTNALATEAIMTAGFAYNEDQDLFTKGPEGEDELVVWIEEVAYNELDLSNGKG